MKEKRILKKKYVIKNSQKFSDAMIPEKAGKK